MNDFHLTCRKEMFGILQEQVTSPGTPGEAVCHGAAPVRTPTHHQAPGEGVTDQGVRGWIGRG